MQIYQAPRILQLQYYAPPQQFHAPARVYHASYQPPQNQFRGPLHQQAPRPREQPAQRRPRVSAIAKSPRQLTQGRVYVVGQVDEQQDSELMEGIFLVFNS